jgi:hypothetical protein
VPDPPFLNFSLGFPSFSPLPGARLLCLVPGCPAWQGWNLTLLTLPGWPVGIWPCWPCRAGWCLAGLDFDPVWKGWQASYKAIYIFMTEDLEIIPGSIHFYDRGSWNHTRQYTFLWWRILKSCQAIYILMTEDLEIIQGNIHSYDRGFRNHARQYTFPWQRILKSYQAIYIPMTEDFEIIPGSIQSYDRGCWPCRAGWCLAGLDLDSVWKGLHLTLLTLPGWLVSDRVAF